MSFMVTWKKGTKKVASRKEAVEFARSLDGVVLVNEHPAGSVTTFRDGRELEGEEATEATMVFMDEGADDA